MLRSSRRVDAPKLGAYLSNVARVHRRLRVHAVENRGIVNEDTLLVRAYTRAGKLERPNATVLLEGVARISAYDRDVWLEPGDVVVVDSKGAIRMRQSGDPYVAIAFEWDPEFVGARGEPILKLSAKHTLESFRATWNAIRGEGSGAPILAELLDQLAKIGVSVNRLGASDLEEEAPERMQTLTDTLDRILSNLADQPMMRDLESDLGLSTRQLNRLIAEYNERYAFNSLGWIDTRNRRRLMIGATFMTAPNATASYVASLVGYQSAAAFARALRLAKMPAPTSIAAEVTRLGVK